MSRGLTPARKREIADNFLTYLKDNGIKQWGKTYMLLLELSEILKEEVYDLWKAFDLLVILGRIERINPNGRQGCRVVSYTALTKPVPSDAVICKRENCPILKGIAEIWK